MTCHIEKCPCSGCGERFPACHDGCDKYKAWKEKRSEVLAKIRADRESYTDHDNQPFWHKYRRDTKRGQK